MQCGVPKPKKQKFTTYMVCFFIYLHCEIHHKSPYNLRFGLRKVLGKSLVLIHQNLWEPCTLQIDQFPTCWPMNGLFVHWSMGWGVSSFSERLIHHVPMIVSSWNFQELLPWTEVMSMQKVKVRGQRSRSRRSTPNLAVSGLQFEFTYGNEIMHTAGSSIEEVPYCF